MTGERGFVATELVAGIGLLLLPVALLVLTLPGWSERQSAARSVAREVARDAAVVGVCDHDRATLVAERIATNLGIAAGETSVALSCAPGRLPRGGDVEARVTVAMPTVAIPGVAEVLRWHWTAVHRQPVDPYRSFG